MRIWKDNKGLGACLIFVLLSAAQFSVSLQAQDRNVGTGGSAVEGRRDREALPPAVRIRDRNPNATDRQGAPSRPPFGGAPGMRGANRPGSDGSFQRGGTRAAASDDIHQVASPKCVPAKGTFVWNFEDEELISILRQVSDLLCVTIVVNDAISKNLKMTIIGKSELTPKDAWDVLLASLSAKGLTLVQQGKTWTVIKRVDSKSHPSPMYSSGKNVRDNEGIGTLFYRAQHTSQDSLKNVAKSLITKDGLVESVGDKFIIVIDSNSNIRRLGKIFDQIDVEEAINRIHIVSLQHAEAKNVEKQIRELFDISAATPRVRRRRFDPAEGKSSVLDIDKIIADERFNRLIFIADQESADRLKEVIDLMDQPADEQSNKGKIYVKKLRYADAKKIAETLNSVLQQSRAMRFPRRRPEEPANELFEGEVKITAHENTNTLVTVASANDYRALLDTINALDVRKEQVYVEAVIMDIQVNGKDEFGVNLFTAADPGKLGLGGDLGFLANPGGRKIAEGVKDSLLKTGAAGASLSGAGASVGALAVLGNFLSGGVAGLVGPDIIKGVPSFGAVLQALSENSSVDVLSTPYLMTTDNQEAVMSVGERIPVIRGASSVGGGSGLGVPIQNIQFEDVKLTFKITPHVGADDNVRLDVEQEVNELGAPEEILNNRQYRIRTKSAKTTLVLKDQQTGVIGGLISHRTSTNDNKVPFLGDIPILGWLFKNRAKNDDKRSLLLILTPYIIRTDSDYRKIAERKLNEREEFARLYYGGKIKNYNKHVDYDKKAGPLSSLLLSVENEMDKVQNGGSGGSDEVIITPKENPPKTSSIIAPNTDAGSRADRQTASNKSGG